MDFYSLEKFSTFFLEYLYNELAFLFMVTIFIKRKELGKNISIKIQPLGEQLSIKWKVIVESHSFPLTSDILE